MKNHKQNEQQGEGGWGAQLDVFLFQWFCCYFLPWYHSQSNHRVGILGNFSNHQVLTGLGLGLSRGIFLGSLEEYLNKVAGLWTFCVFLWWRWDLKRLKMLDDFFHCRVLVHSLFPPACGSKLLGTQNRFEKYVKKKIGIGIHPNLKFQTFCRFSYRIYEKIWTWQFFVTFLGWLSDPFQWLSDLHLRDEKVTLNHLEM